MKLRCYFRAAVLMKNRLHDELGEQIEERLHPDQQRRSHSSSNTSWWDKSGWNWKWAHKFSDFVTVGFVYSRLRSTVTDGWCGQMHLTDKITHAHVITFSSEHCFFFVFFLSLSCLYFLSHCLLVLCSAHQLRCGRNRWGLKPLHSRTKRSIAPWRYTTLSEEQRVCPHQVTWWRFSSLLDRRMCVILSSFVHSQCMHDHLNTACHTKTMEELGMVVTDKKSTRVNSCKESAKRETEVFNMVENLADDVKVEDGDRGRVRKTLKQLRKEIIWRKRSSCSPGRNAGNRGWGPRRRLGNRAKTVSGARGVHVLMWPRIWKTTEHQWHTLGNDAKQRYKVGEPRWRFLMKSLRKRASRWNESAKASISGPRKWWRQSVIESKKIWGQTRRWKA